MKTLVVFCAFAAVACGSLVPLAQPPHHPAVVLDPHGRPLDTADVIHARAVHLQAKALEHSVPVVHAGVVPVAYSIAAPVAHVAHVAPVVYAAPAAVSHQSRVDVHTSPAIVGHAIASPVLAHSVLGHEHWLKKRSIGHLDYSAPIIVPSAVSHQARVDVISSPAVVSHAVAPVVTHAVHSPVAVAPAAVSHQSRVDVRTSPAVVAHSVAVPVVSHIVDVPVAHNIWDATVYGAHSHGHFLKKRSLAAYVTPYVHAAPTAVSHQSRVDVVSTPTVVAHAAPVAVEHVVPAVVAVPAAVSHQARVDVISSDAHVVPLAHHAVLTAPAHWGYSRLFNGHW